MPNEKGKNRENRLNSPVLQGFLSEIYFTKTFICPEVLSLSTTVIDVFPALRPLTVTTSPFTVAEAMALSFTVTLNGSSLSCSEPPSLPTYQR